MGEDISKTVIRIIQDYCFNSSATILNNEFVLTISPLVTKSIKGEKLNLREFRQIVKRRMDFIHANDLDMTTFCKGLFYKLNYELSFYADISFKDSIIEFKRKMENGNFRGYPRNKINEDTLRCTLALYIQQETFCEPRSGAGNNDITIPSQKVVIETKLWNGKEYYTSGFPELNDYLDKSNYNEGFYIVFDYNKIDNEVIKIQGEVFDELYQGKLIHIIFIRMNATRPSQIYKESRKTIKKSD